MVPLLCKKCIITPVPKKSGASDNNDFRPIVITSLVMKCLEKYVVAKLKSNVNSLLDSFQFAYKERRGTVDAVNTVVHLILQHLENPNAYARLLFVDFSSAFNTLQPELLLDKLVKLDVNPFIIKWLVSFLTNRTQRVKVNGTLLNQLVWAPLKVAYALLFCLLYTQMIA